MADPANMCLRYRGDCTRNRFVAWITASMTGETKTRRCSFTCTAGPTPEQHSSLSLMRCKVAGASSHRTGAVSGAPSTTVIRTGFPDYLADSARLLQAYSPDAPARLVGHSMGANVASLYAGTMPERVSALVNVEGFGLKDSDPGEAPQRYRDWLTSGRSDLSSRPTRTSRHWPRSQQTQSGLTESRQILSLANGQSRKTIGFDYARIPGTSCPTRCCIAELKRKPAGAGSVRACCSSAATAAPSPPSSVNCRTCLFPASTRPR